jgi:putative transposase
VSEPIGEIPEKVDYYTQQSALKETKALYPEYKDIWAESQQVNLQRLKKAWERWMIPDATGKRGGRPRFKKSGELRSFVYPRINCPKAGAYLKARVLKLSKIGSMPVVIHRPIPDGFVLKTCTIVRKADGWYCCISMQNDTVPTFLRLDEVKTAIGIDVGLKAFLATSDGQTVPVQQIYRKAQARLARQQRKLARKPDKSSKNAIKQANRVARVHQRLQRQRKDFHYKIAHWLVKTYDLIAVEDLNIRGLARTKLAKSVLDVAWGQFITILAAVGVKSGVRVVKVNPYGTSQDCSECGTKVLKDLSIRTHECHKCGCVLDRDVNAAVNISQRGLSAVGLTVPACGGLDDSQPLKQEVLGVTLRNSRYIAFSN